MYNCIRTPLYLGLDVLPLLAIMSRYFPVQCNHQTIIIVAYDWIECVPLTSVAHPYYGEVTLLKNSSGPQLMLNFALPLRVSAFTTRKVLEIFFRIASIELKWTLTRSLTRYSKRKKVK